jgi:hypothetical protein
MTYEDQISSELDALGLHSALRRQALRFAVTCLVRQRRALLEEIDNFICTLADESARIHQSLCTPQPSVEDVDEGYKAMMNEHLAPPERRV